MKIQVSITKETSGEDLRDILVTALEGGIGYWAVCSWPDSMGYQEALELFALGKVAFTIQDDEGDEDPAELTRDRLLSGLGQWMEEKGTVDIDPGQIDASDADCIVQLALFKTVIYG